MNREDAARYVGVSSEAFRGLIRSGKMPNPVVIDTTEVWDRVALDRAFDVLASDQFVLNEPPPKTFTPASLAKRWVCSERHVRNMVKSGFIKPITVGGKLLRISAAEVNRIETTPAARR
jgi:hypothetical protein